VSQEAGEVASPAQRWRDLEPDLFAQTVLVAAERLDVQPLAVEKDYWVCESLRAIVANHPGEVIFKGGTSLEKLRIIRRFSEDLDLLVVGEYESNNAARKALKAMCASAAELTGAQQSDPQSGGSPGSYHRRTWLHPPLTHVARNASAIADAKAVLLELGQSGGRHPSKPHEVSSLLTRQLLEAEFDVAAFADLTPFDVDVLHPGRTLLEKLLRINNFATKASDDEVHGWPRIGRQFYDVWALLGEQAVLDLLADTTQVREILSSCYDESQAFTPDEPLPAGGFAASAAFAVDGPLTQRLRREHVRAMDDLYYGQDEPPSFDDVLQRVSQHAHLLDISS
jgi:hypothetical protein